MPVVDTETKAIRAFQALRQDPNALERLASKGVRNFLLASGDGLVIDAVTASKTLDVDEIAASATSSLNVARAKAADLRLGAVKGIVVEFESGEAVILDPVASDAMAVYLADSPEGMEQLGRELPHLKKILAPGRDYLAPETTPQETPARAPAPAAPAPAAPAEPQAVTPPPPVGHAPVAPAAPRAAAPRPTAPAEGARRLTLRKAEMETVGFTASAMVEISLGDRHVVGKAVGRNIPDQYLALAAEATIRAVNEFLPAGYGIVLQNIQPVSSATEVAVWTNVIFITPMEEQLLPGIARLEGQPTLAAAKTILSAINRRLERVLADLAG